MENQPTNQQNNYQLPSLPNATAVLVLGILSIVFFICYICAGVIGLTLGIIALVLAKKDNKLYLENPNTYSETSFNNIKAGKICAIIGICLSSIWVVVGIIYLIFFVLIAGTSGAEIFNTLNNFH